MTHETIAKNTRPKKKRPTLGEAALAGQERELLETKPLSVNDIARNMLHGNADAVSEGKAKSYLQRVWDEATDAFQKLGTDYCFIEVRYKSTGPLAHNTVDKLFIGRITCPTPTYNQDAFRVFTDGSIEFLWSIPSQLDVKIIMDKRFELALDPHYSELVKMVLGFCEGSLHKMVTMFDAEYDEMIKGNA